MKQSDIPYLPSEEVADALAENRPVVALESTIISHGMPYPQNLETANKVETIVRESGAVPATIALIKGKICVGLPENDLHFLAESKEMHKASRRDMAYIISQGKSAATTVAATMICADIAGIRMFATGGIGGVHRGAQQSFDISADLQELARTRVAVVSAGVKSILDIPLTLEYLETMGVPVVGLGTNDFPAFYTRSSGSQAPFRLDTAEEIAKMIFAQQQLGLGGGFLIANPVPEAYSMDKKTIDQAIETALAAADREGISGKAVTPYLLAKIKEITQGKSLFSNIQLVYNNARVASEIACCLAAMNLKN
ncbi:MAG: pseudouridine-5'-phosphate glycosidase [Bacteroidia bacterium]